MQLVDTSSLLPDPSAAGVVIVDPRRAVRYLQGHIQGAINVPAAKAFDADGALLADEALAVWLTELGVPSDIPLLLYDDADGRDGAMLAWILEYLGHVDVRFLRQPFSHWRDLGGELYYRPVTPPPARFTPRPIPELRARRQDVQRAIAEGAGPVLLDTRTREEFVGDVEVDGRGGHLPNAVHVPWEEFRPQEGDLFLTAPDAARILKAAGIAPGRPIIAYCQRGPRAAVPTMALRLHGYDVRLYDGSFSDWIRDRGAPIER